MRVVSNISSEATLTATTEAGTLVVGNLQSDRKSDIWRSTTKTETITAIFTEQKYLSLAALPFCNLTITATFQIKCYTLSGDAVAVYDSGAVPCRPYTNLENFDWGNAPLGVNSFSYGGALYARVWFPDTLCEKIEIIIVDNDNTSAYLEAGVLVLGQHWEPSKDADWGANSYIVDSTTNKRTESGDDISNRGTIHRGLSINLGTMSSSDRSTLHGIMGVNGKYKPFFISIYPENGDPELEQDSQIYGKFKALSKVSNTYFNNFSSSINVEES